MGSMTEFCHYVGQKQTQPLGQDALCRLIQIEGNWVGVVPRLSPKKIIQNQGFL